MGAALHLAHAHQAPPGPKRKRGGGGSNDGYDALVRRVYGDDRHTPGSRELILCLAWLRCRDPQRYDDTGQQPTNIYERANRILGFEASRTPRLAWLLNYDRPRYQADRKHSAWIDRCNAPMIRRAGECGQAPRGNSFRIDPDTGWHTPIWYCHRHRDFGAAADAALRAVDKPEPIPNTGGLLPSYFNMRTGDAGWTRLYQWAAGWCRVRDWEPPVKYGMAADDWPRPDRRPVPAEDRPRLRLAALDGELIDK